MLDCETPLLSTQTFSSSADPYSGFDQATPEHTEKCTGLAWKL